MILRTTATVPHSQHCTRASRSFTRFLLPHHSEAGAEGALHPCLVERDHSSAIASGMRPTTQVLRGCQCRPMMPTPINDPFARRNLPGSDKPLLSLCRSLGGRGRRDLQPGWPSSGLFSAWCLRQRGESPMIGFVLGVAPPQRHSVGRVRPEGGSYGGRLSLCTYPPPRSARAVPPFLAISKQGPLPDTCRAKPDSLSTGIGPALLGRVPVAALRVPGNAIPA